MTTTRDGFRSETDSLGEVLVPGDKLWGAQTQRSLRGPQPAENVLSRC